MRVDDRPMIENVTLVFATIGRPQCARRLIESVRTAFAELKIVVADQNDLDPEMHVFYERNRVRTVYTGDVGVASARNFAVREVATEFVLLADDDFVILPETDLQIPLGILAVDREVDIVGGLVVTVPTDLADLSRSYVTRWERYLHLDRERGMLIALPIDHSFPVERRIGDVRYFRCDTVLNWALFRLSVFKRGFSWDERFSCNGEHEDFYLTIKEQGPVAEVVGIGLS